MFFTSFYDTGLLTIFAVWWWWLSSSDAHHEWQTFASLEPDCLFFWRFPLISSFFPLSVLLMYVFIRRARQNSSRFLPGMLMVCWLLFAAKGIWNRADVRGQNNNSGVLWGRRSDCWLGTVDLCRCCWRFFCNFGTRHRNFRQTTGAVALRFFQDSFHQIHECCKGTSLCSGTLLQQQLLWPFSNKLSPASPVIWQCVTALFEWVFSQICISCAWFVLRGCKKGTSSSCSLRVLCGGRQTMCTPFSLEQSITWIFLEWE